MGSQKEDILETARKKGLSNGVGDSQADELRKIAQQVGMDHYDSTSNADTDELQRRLNETELNSNSDGIELNTNADSAELQQPASANTWQGPGVDPNRLKQGFGRNQFARTVGNPDYYKNREKDLERRRQEAEQERQNKYKKAKNPMSEDEDKKSESKNKSGNNKEGQNNSSKEKNSTTNENKRNSKNETQKNANQKNKTQDQQKKSTEPKEKNIFDKVKDNANVAKAGANQIKNKVEKSESKIYQMAHPVEAAKIKAKEKAKRYVIAFLRKYWWAILILAAIFLFVILLVLLILAILSEIEDEPQGYLDPRYDYTASIVVLTNPATGEIIDSRLTLGDLVIGSVYYETRNDITDMSLTQKNQLYKTYALLFKTIALGLGGYNNDDKTLTIKSGEDLPYCDPYNGCVIKRVGSKNVFVPKSLEDSVSGTVIEEIPPMSEGELTRLREIYSDYSTIILTPKNVNSAITSYNYTIPEYNSSKKSEIKNLILDDKSYQDVIKEVYPNYKEYDIKEYATIFQQNNYGNNTAYWWPIGSASPTSGNIYGGDPTSTVITSEFTPYRCIQGDCRAHNGIDIGGSMGSSVVIATKSGTVTTASDTCPSNGYYCSNCGGGYGNWVMLDHGDGTTSVYAHLYSGSVAVHVGEQVQQGQKIGIMGSSGCSTGAHTHFEIRVNGNYEDPLNYVDPSNPRPVAINPNGDVVTGDSCKQTVCLTLKSDGFNDSAIVAVMANMYAESGFDYTNDTGDGGTSGGLCQWHNGRLTNLKNFCSPNWKDCGCQVRFLLNELPSSYPGTYNMLNSNASAYEKTDYYCKNFEIPANRETVCAGRASGAESSFGSYVANNCR